MTELEIANSALQKVGAEMITALNDNNKRAKLVNEQYSKIRDMLLHRYAWNFSIFRDTLTADLTAPEYEFGFRYAVPADCLRVLELEHTEYDFRVESGYILCDLADEIKIKYIKKITDTTKYSALFCELLATAIAVDIAYPLVQSNSLKETLKQEYAELLREARSLNSQEGTPKEFYKGFYTEENR